MNDVKTTTKSLNGIVLPLQKCIIVHTSTYIRSSCLLKIYFFLIFFSVCVCRYTWWMKSSAPYVVPYVWKYSKILYSCHAGLHTVKNNLHFIQKETSKIVVKEIAVLTVFYVVTKLCSNSHHITIACFHPISPFYLH